MIPKSYRRYLLNLSAKGESVIHNIEQIDRGYEAIDLRRSEPGGEIERVE